MCVAWPELMTRSMQRRQRARRVAVRQSQLQRWCLMDALARAGLARPRCDRSDAATQTTASSRRRSSRIRRSGRTSQAAATSTPQEATEAEAYAGAVLQTTEELESKIKQRPAGKAEVEVASMARAEAVFCAEDQSLEQGATDRCHWPEAKANAMTVENRSDGTDGAAAASSAVGVLQQPPGVRVRSREAKEPVLGGVRRGRTLAFLSKEDLSRADAASWQLAETVVAALADVLI